MLGFDSKVFLDPVKLTVNISHQRETSHQHSINLRPCSATWPGGLPGLLCVPLSPKHGSWRLGSIFRTQDSAWHDTDSNYAGDYFFSNVEVGFRKFSYSRTVI